MTEHSLDLVVFAIVVGSRILVPLLIPKFPLPSIVIALIIDAADQTIFQQFTHLDLENYQSYDKALDIYYLAIAYLATMRNWTNQVAFNTSRFLFYYRLVGVALFELTHVRALLLVFPNTFEYFFIWYETVRLRWNPVRMSKKTVLAAAAFIWIVIKLPQEYWLHIAQLDTTDLVKEDLFGVPVETGWGTIIADNWLFFVGLIAILSAMVLGLRYIIETKLPPPDRKASFDADAFDKKVTAEAITQSESYIRSKVFTIELVEKVALISLITIIFGRINPRADVHPAAQTVVIGIIVIANTVISEWWWRRGRGWESAVSQFVTMFVVNTIIILVSYFLPGEHSFNLGGSLFMVYLLSIIITLYDRYRPIYLARFGDDRIEAKIERKLNLT